MSALAPILAAAYALRGVPAIFTPASGTGPVACVAIVGPVAVGDAVARMVGVGDRAPGFHARVRQGEIAARPKQGDLLSVPGAALTLRITLAVTSPADDEWYLTAVPIVTAPAVSTGIGHLQPPLLGGWAWA